MTGGPLRRHRRMEEQGSSLIEILVAVALMGVAFAIIIGGIGAAIIGAGAQKQHATTNVVLRSAAEAIAYQPCADLAFYQDPANAPASPAGFALSVTEVMRLNADGTQFEAPSAGCTPMTDTGLALITITVTTIGGRQQVSDTLQVVKRRL